MAPWLPSGRIRAHEHEWGGFSAAQAGALTSDGLKTIRQDCMTLAIPI